MHTVQSTQHEHKHIHKHKHKHKPHTGLYCGQHIGVGGAGQSDLCRRKEMESW